MLQNQQYLILLWTFLYSIHMYSIHIYIYMCVCIDLFNICFCWPKRGDVRDVNINCKISTICFYSDCEMQMQSLATRGSL